MSKYFKVSTNKAPLDYRCGENIVFTVDAHDNNTPFALDFVRWELKGDDGKVSTGSARCPFTVETTLDRPGYVYLVCKAFDQDNNLRTDIDVLEAGAGAEVEKITLCHEEPADFDAFWTEVEKTVADFTPVLLKKEKVTVTPPVGMEDYACYNVHISTPLGTPVTGYLTVPDGNGPFPLHIHFAGYSILTPLPLFDKNHITLMIGAHGLENGLNKFEQWDLQRVKDGYGFDKQENATPKTAYWYGMMLRDLCAAKFAKTLPEWDKVNFTCEGGSQGAMQATCVAAHDKDITLLRVSIPWFCNMNGENVGLLGGWRPVFAEGLRYYDTVTQASRVKCPVYITAFLGDYVCPPYGITAMYNAVKGEKQLVMIQAGTHHYRPPVIERSVLFNFGYGDQTMPKGKYKHYKGGEYELLDVGTDSETYEQRIAYKNCKDGTLWIRPLHMWNETVYHNGKFVKRFTKI